MPRKILLPGSFCCLAAMLVGAVCYAFSASMPEQPVAPLAAPVSHASARAVLNQDTFYIGAIEVGQKGEHTFVVGNQGTADLTLKAGPTSCKCTRAQVLDARVPPGGTGRVRIAWHTDKPADSFLQGVDIITNDPRNKSLKLTLSGIIRSRLAVSPEAALLPAARSDEKSTARVVVYSQVWKEIEIVRVESPHARLTWKMEPADAATVADLSATAAQVLHVTLEPGMPVGPVYANLLIHCQPGPGFEPAAAAPPIIVNLPVRGEVVGNISLHGADFLDEGVLNIGSITQGEGAHRTVHLFVHGADRELVVRDIQCQPGFVQVLVKRETKSRSKAAHYRIDVTVPADAPPADHLGRNLGKVRILTDNPATPVIEFHLALAIVSRGTSANRHAGAAFARTLSPSPKGNQGRSSYDAE